MAKIVRIAALSVVGPVAIVVTLMVVFYSMGSRRPASPLAKRPLARG